MKKQLLFGNFLCSEPRVGSESRGKEAGQVIWDLNVPQKSVSLSKRVTFSDHMEPLARWEGENP